MRAFLFCILLRTIHTNKYLFLCKLAASDKCYFYNENTESIEYVFTCVHWSKTPGLRDKNDEYSRKRKSKFWNK